jgi:hypothetical protein
LRRTSATRHLAGMRSCSAAYPDGTGGLDLQPFFDLITIHELGHAFEVLGDLRLPTFWLSEIFVNLAMHAFVATQLPASLPTLEVLPTVGAGSRKLAARMRGEGYYSTLEELQAHYTGGDDSMDPLNYVWYQYRWLRLAQVAPTRPLHASRDDQDRSIERCADSSVVLMPSGPHADRPRRFLGGMPVRGLHRSPGRDRDDSDREVR